jgi:GntR family phosphonate transport system transcriptional regulator
MTEQTSFNAPSFERQAGLAVWRQLEIQLADDIQKGRIGGDGRLPTEAALAQRFAVNRHTVRRAISALTGRGLIRVERGRGMFVEDVVLDYPLTRRTSFSANLLGQGRAPASDVVSIDLMKADRTIADALALRAGALVICRRAVGLADDVPINVSLTFFPNSRFPALAEQFETTMSITSALRACGVNDYRRLSTRILTRLPTPSEAAALRQPAAQPVLVTEAVDVDLEDRPISYGVTCFAGGRVQITVEPD